MSHIIEANTCPEAWVRACNYLVGKKGFEDRNVVLDISNPLMMSPQDNAIYSLVDQFLTSRGSKSLVTVANTIFPAYLYRSGGLGKLFQYPEIIGRFGKDALGGWGTYACRMMKVVDLEGHKLNPLQIIIDKINRYFPDRGRYGKCYELGTLKFDGDIQLYDCREDGGRSMSGPCLSHVSVKVSEGKNIELTALYRNHYYVDKLLGNLIGLTLLQDCIARETKMKTGSLIIHSTSAELDTGKKWNITDVKKLIVDAQTVISPKAA